MHGHSLQKSLIFGAVAVLLPGACLTPLKAANTFKTLYQFCAQPGCTDGNNPEAGLVADSAGDLFGTTLAGGTGFGTVFELVRGAHKWTFKQLYSFCSLSGCSDGVSPKAALIVDTAGNLYGTASGGGDNGEGVAFELAHAKSKWKFSTLYAFCSTGACADGSVPSGTDIGSNVAFTYSGANAGQPYDGTSPLYGATESGGANNSGVVFSLSHRGGKWTEKVIYSFCSLAGCADGSEPGNLLMSGTGTIYGTTASGDGTIFSLTPNAKATKWKLTTLYTMCKLSNCADGDVPDGLVLDTSGNLLGTTEGGGAGSSCPFSSGCGVAFSLVPQGVHSKQTVIYNFCASEGCPDGAQPASGLALDSSGNLFGATNIGGTDNCTDGCGTAFKLQGTNETVLHQFCPQENCTEGTSPGAGVVLDSAGDVFGTTDFGGQAGGGTVYEITP